MLLIERKKVKQMESNDFCDLLLMLLDDDLFWVEREESKDVPILRTESSEKRRH